MKKIVPKDARLVPDYAARVFEGKIFDVYQWQQDMFDGSQSTFEMLKRPDTLQVLAVHEGKVLVVLDEQPGRKAKYSLPGGRLDDTDESWEAAAKRELLEETGLTFAKWRLIKVRQATPKIEQFVPTYLVTDLIKQQEQSVDVAGEKIAVEWWPYEKLREAAISGEHLWLEYHAPLLAGIQTLDDLLAFPDYHGTEVDR